MGDTDPGTLDLELDQLEHRAMLMALVVGDGQAFPYKAVWCIWGWVAFVPSDVL